jgi:hypothetical protein
MTQFMVLLPTATSSTNMSTVEPCQSTAAEVFRRRLKFHTVSPEPRFDAIVLESQVPGSVRNVLTFRWHAAGPARAFLWQIEPKRHVATIRNDEIVGSVDRAWKDHLRQPRSPERSKTGVAFEDLFRARTDRSALFDLLVRASDPCELLDVALEAFAKKGNQDRLELASRLLAEMGVRALPAFQRIANQNVDGQDTFVDLIVRSNALSDTERQNLVRQLARSSLGETRDRLLETLDALPSELATEVKRVIGARRN